MAKAEGKPSTRREEFPLDSPNWISLRHILPLLGNLLGNADLAAKDLTAKAREGDVPIMRRYAGRAVGFPDCQLVPVECWLKGWIGGDGHVYEGYGQYVMVRGYAFFAWKPALAKVWPDVFASTSPSRVPTPSSPALISDPAADHELSTQARRGRKFVYDWELYKAKFFLMLDNDDVPANDDIDVHHYADELRTWSSKNGEEKIPDDSTMRAKITEWKPLWRRLKSLNK